MLLLIVLINFIHEKLISMKKVVSNNAFNMSDDGNCPLRTFATSLETCGICVEAVDTRIPNRCPHPCCVAVLWYSNPSYNVNYSSNSFEAHAPCNCSYPREHIHDCCVAFASAHNRRLGFAYSPKSEGNRAAAAWSSCTWPVIALIPFCCIC